MMSKVIHVDQTYCAPSRLISDNITFILHILDVSGSLGGDAGLISMLRKRHLAGLNISIYGRHWKLLGPAQVLLLRSRYCTVTLRVYLKLMVAWPHLLW